MEIAPGIHFGNGRLPVISGPCVIESAEHALGVAETLKAMASRVDFPLIFKASYDKANRSSETSFRGPGLEKGLEILAQIKAETGLPVLTDVHEPGHCEKVAEVCDILQIPAFLCRQTDLIHAAADTGCTVNIKKGQFVAPGDMPRAVDKARTRGNERIFVTERGYCFGYNNLVVDMRAFAMLRQAGIDVIFDVTHSLQLPGGGEVTGGAREYAEPLARAAVAAGAAGLFVEVHPDPPNALSDATTQLPPPRAEALLSSVLAVHRILTVS